MKDAKNRLTKNPRTKNKKKPSGKKLPNGFSNFYRKNFCCKFFALRKNYFLLRLSAKTTDAAIERSFVRGESARLVRTIGADAPMISPAVSFSEK